MKKIPLITLALASSAATSFGAVVVVSEANFDTTNTLNGGNNGASLTTTDGSTAPLTAPAGSTGEVGMIDSGGTNIWGAVNDTPQVIPLPAGTVPGVDTFTATFRVYVPAATTYNGTDRVNLIVRRNGDNGANFNSNNVWNTLAPNTWETITVSNTIPEFQSDGTTPVTGMMPILSFYDRIDAGNAEAGAGVAAYIDDWQMTMTTSIPEPSTGLVAMMALGLIGLRRKR